ncbi:MAG: hypothetical protein U0529_03250 [Thermoanaerobaculia bacterium]
MTRIVRDAGPEVIRRRVHRWALVGCGVFAFVVSVVLIRPGVYLVGPLSIGLDSLRNPLLELGAAVLVALATGEHSHLLLLEASRRFRLAWSGGTTGGKAFALVLAAKVVMTGVDLARLSDQLFSGLREGRPEKLEPLEEVFARGGRYAQFERFFGRCRRELPDDARVLYVGRAEGQLLAYVLYPRPVFMHPTDRYVAWVGHQVLDLGLPLPDDPLFPGGLAPPLEAPSLETFVAARRITHEVRFVESDLAACRIEAIR